jgi:hypothetical protein
MKQGPEIPVALENNMTTPAAIASIRTRKRIELCPHKMLVACTAMAATAKNSYLVNKIAFLQGFLFEMQR